MKKMNLTEATCKILEGKLHEEYNTIGNGFDNDLLTLAENLRTTADDLRSVFGMNISPTYGQDTNTPNILETAINISKNLEKYANILEAMAPQSNNYEDFEHDDNYGDFLKPLV